MRSLFPSVLSSSGANNGIIRIEMKFPGGVCIVDTATKFNSSVSSDCEKNTTRRPNSFNRTITLSL